MMMSRQFNALARISGLFGVAWAAVGGSIGLARGPSLIGDERAVAALSFAFMYGCVGAIAGLITALVISRAEHGRDAGSVPRWRMTGWGIVGGVAPAGLFGALGLLAGAPLSAIWPLAGTAVIGGCIGGLITRSTSGAPNEYAERTS
jgi:hypothetical protein